MPTDTAPRVRVLTILSLLVVPWTVVLVGTDLTLVMAWGLFDPVGPHVTVLPEYLAATGGAPPPFLLAWPVGVGIYGLGIASAVLEVLDRGDPRVTAGLLVLVGITQLTVTRGFLRRGGYLVVPLGTLLAWTIAWWFYWADLRALAGFDP